MQEYPVRSIVSEPFVHQLEVIEKTLIEVRNQPSSYYSRRSNRMTASQQGQASGQSNPYYNKYGNFYQQHHQQQQQQQQQQQHQVSDWYRRDYKNSINVSNINSGMGGTGASLGSGVGGNVAAGLGPSGGFSSTHSNESSGSVNVDSGISSVGSLNLGAPTHVPQVFDDKYEAHGFATFDPFESKDYTKGGMFQPMFNSSNNILGSGFSGNSNIWGDTNKTMASDAAVWG